MTPGSCSAGRDCYPFSPSGDGAAILHCTVSCKGEVESAEGTEPGERTPAQGGRTPCRGTPCEEFGGSHQAETPLPSLVMLPLSGKLTDNCMIPRLRPESGGDGPSRDTVARTWRRPNGVQARDSRELRDMGTRAVASHALLRTGHILPIDTLLALVSNHECRYRNQNLRVPRITTDAWLVMMYVGCGADLGGRRSALSRGGRLGGQYPPMRHALNGWTPANPPSSAPPRHLRSEAAHEPPWGGRTLRTPIRDAPRFAST